MLACWSLYLALHSGRCLLLAAQWYGRLPHQRLLLIVYLVRWCCLPVAVTVTFLARVALWMLPRMMPAVTIVPFWPHRLWNSHRGVAVHVWGTSVRGWRRFSCFAIEAKLIILESGMGIWGKFSLVSVAIERELLFSLGGVVVADRFADARLI